MVATAAIVDQIESGLMLLEGDIQALPDLAEEWEQLGESAQVTLSLEWDHAMADYLLELDERYRDGQMTATQQSRYRALISNLECLRPIIMQLDLYLPPVADWD